MLGILYIYLHSFFQGLYRIGDFELQSANELPILKLISNISWPNDKIPIDVPYCGFNGEFCLQEYTSRDIVLGIFGCIAIMFSIVIVLTYRNYRYEQELDSLLWKIDFTDMHVRIKVTVYMAFLHVFHINGFVNIFSKRRKIFYLAKI